MTDTTIQPLPADFDRWQALLDLIVNAFASMDGVIDPPSSARALTPQSLQDKALKEQVFLAQIDGRLVGCIFCAARADRLYVGKLAVDPAFQGRGIGAALMEQAAALARESGKIALELQARIELTGNHAAFSRMGFRETVRTSHAGYARPTSITMRKELI